MKMMMRRKLKYLNCLMFHSEMNLSSAQNVISSCDQAAKLKYKKNYIEYVCDFHRVSVKIVMKILLMLDILVSIITV